MAERSEPYLVLNDAQARILLEATSEVAIYDAEGLWLGTATPGLPQERITRRKARVESPESSSEFEELINHLRAREPEYPDPTL